METSQEFQQTIVEAVKRTGRYVLELVKELPKSLSQALINRTVAVGSTAGSLNALEVKCPECESVGRWTDV